MFLVNLGRVPDRLGRQLSLYQVAREISDRLISTFLADADGRRPVHGGQPILQSDPHWRDLLLFYEYFHGDNGAGIGASHQTGWTGAVALLPLLFRGVSAEGLRNPRLWRHQEARAPADGGDAMTGWPDQPVIYEINTAVWLNGLARAAGRRVTLAEVAGADWDAVTPPGVDAVWLMGVWERSPAGLALANANPELQASFLDALPDLQRADVIGSPYCVRRYVADAAFGGPAALAAARAALAERGARLILDYVPNHVAPDHPWVSSRPELFIRGDEHDIKADPAGWMAAAGQVLAHGRDPYFRPGPMSYSSTRSRRPCAPRRPARSRTSPASATGSAATWPC